MEFYIIENMIKLNDKEMEFQILLFLIVIFFFFFDHIRILIFVKFYS